MNYAILDIETTGGKFNEEGIIEIAIFKFDGEKVIDSFISMVNPERKIHFYVQKLTGITNKMVRTAPKFYELAKRLVEITEDTIIVAHNVAFDYRVIQAEFQRLGFDFQRSTLDTIKLSETLIPNMTSYSLGNLCQELGIPLSDRHRAHGDARATVQLFQLLLTKDSHKDIIQSFIKNNSSSLSINKKILNLLENLPQQAGVFYLHDKDGKIVYIASSDNISIRTRLVLTNESKKSKNLQRYTETITYELAGNEIIAKIKALNEETVNNPKFKSTKEPLNFTHGIFLKKDQLVISPLNHRNKKNAWLGFSSINKAESFLKKNEFPSPYNKQYFFLQEKHLLLAGKGRQKNEHSFLFLEEGVLKGYGFYNLHSQIKDIKRIEKIMIPALASPNLLLQIRNLLFIKKQLIKIPL